MNNDTAIMENIEIAETAVNDCILSAHQAVIDEINWDISGLPEGTGSRIEDSFASVIFNTNEIIAQYCASKDKWDEINMNDLKSVINANKDKLFTYIKTMTTEGNGDNRMVVWKTRTFITVRKIKAILRKEFLPR